MFGKNFKGYEKAIEEEQIAEQLKNASVTQTSTDPSKGKKSKAAAKAGTATYQFQIMQQLGIQTEDIHKFADPLHWCDFFPPLAIQDMTAFGTKVDWRRSFITTDANPYYDSFVRWQMNILKQLDKIRFGERYTIYSPVDKQPCMDHDRQSGEALGPQEYTAIKLQVTEWAKTAQEALGKVSELSGKNVYFVAATLRPETMYGQTNCFVGTEIKYGLYQVNDKDVFFITERAARNMAYQKIFNNFGEIKKIAEIKGDLVVGTKVKAPLSKYPEVYVLPMENVLATKGTGVVTSVPSDSPDDFATLQDLQKKAAYYKIEAEWAAFEPIPIINTPSYGNLTAPYLCKLKKINSQKDRVQLAEAKELAYKEGFYQGTMVIGDYKGLPVQEAKSKIRDELIQSGEGFVYNEPEGLVMSRSGDECVVALLDQWYLDYGEEHWKAQAVKCLAEMNTYTNETRHSFEQTLDWLNKWACARSFGLGSKLPWDPQFLVESLSDSTIYMAYYTVAHLLHSGSLNGSKVGPAGIKHEEMTDAAWSYIFSLGEYSDSIPVPQATLDKLKREYEYFYPLDVRVSGKDLVPNHLTFFIYNHTAIFPEEKWPRSVRVNGHLMLNREKMSKSTGNFLTLDQAIEKYGADATRLALADAGDGVEDANFEDTTANAAILRLYTLLEWFEEHLKSNSELRTGEFSFHDKVFETEMNNLIIRANEAYASTLYRDALKYGFYELQSSRDWYQQVCGNGMHRDLVNRFIEMQTLLLTPICPFWAEHVWSTLLAKPNTIMNAKFPKPSSEIDLSILSAAEYVRKTVKSIRDTELAQLKKKKKQTEVAYNPDAPKTLKLYVATHFPEWQDAGIQILKDNFDEATGKFDDAKIRDQLKSQGLMANKKMMPFLNEQKVRKIKGVLYGSQFKVSVMKLTCLFAF
jgi:leucyl-tRNA synthetase